VIDSDPRGGQQQATAQIRACRGGNDIGDAEEAFWVDMVCRPWYADHTSFMIVHYIASAWEGDGVNRMYIGVCKGMLPYVCTMYMHCTPA
jgi:hypothetical protein